MEGHLVWVYLSLCPEPEVIVVMREVGAPVLVSTRGDQVQSTWSSDLLTTAVRPLRHVRL